MKKHKIKDWPTKDWPKKLFEIPKPPKSLRKRGENTKIFNSDIFKTLCVVGPRKHSEYARMACQKIISGLCGYPIVIVSGLAYGIDSIAHKSALENKIPTIAVLGSGLSDGVIYPKYNLDLATQILNAGGCLISEFDDYFTVRDWSFPQRNRIMVGISDAILIIEASEKSGTMITARLATDSNRDILTIPGSIFSENSIGSNKLIKDGAGVILDSNDILDFFGFEIKDKKDQRSLDELSKNEKLIYQNLSEPKEIEQILRETNLSIIEFNIAISLLEIKDLVENINNKICKK